MRASVDISLYPNNPDFVPPIKAFIDQLNQYPELTVQTFPTATVVQGELARIMEILAIEIESWRSKNGMGVFVTKILPDYEAL